LLENLGKGKGEREKGCSRWKALVQRSKRHRAGGHYGFYDAQGAKIAGAELIEEQGEFRVIEFDHAVDDDWLDRYGHIPLPPYIRRPDTAADADRYQTVYADVCGSAAAPTAGLHFTHELMKKLTFTGIECLFITLHVGMGTFLPVRSENIEDHFMHEESFCIDENTAARIEKAKAEGRKIAAVGTTSLRALESAWREFSGLKRGEGSASIFIYPGFEFKAADMLFTNFHTPESTLLMLVSAFAGAGEGRELILESYNEAIREGYRFFFFFDAMLIV
jgi:S-adenosylmethionine:tRNA ribosyltransferase-isomerase